MLLDDEILIDAPRAEAVTADRCLALVDELEAQWADQALEVLIRINLLLNLWLLTSLDGSPRCLRVYQGRLWFSWCLITLQLLVLLNKLFLFHEFVQQLQLFISVNDSLAAILVL